ncbi:hypothetical protein EA462_10535 [Natrarchaeobius halalkaliphilus]|uniref:Uncharacterized protein n=1 Tax=Natrarchaeobius halalkaliphilus TaxID=1679091 RepID=A0A3N6LZU0_9EURY|nr:hypothetical protein [Natrarchaeobius halalkaliphilus]RQG88830.1 hypothetical protein EA462_10535 [Natrarchaeobius halalkaliphilus]
MIGRIAIGLILIGGIGFILSTAGYSAFTGGREAIVQVAPAAEATIGIEDEYNGTPIENGEGEIILDLKNNSPEPVELDVEIEDVGGVDPESIEVVQHPSELQPNGQGSVTVGCSGRAPGQGAANVTFCVQASGTSTAIEASKVAQGLNIDCPS